MKYLIVALLILPLLSMPAFGRLGEDENTSSYRYGDPIKEEQVQDSNKKVYYDEEPYNMEITYKDGRTVIIAYQLKGPAKRMSIWRIEHILHDNAQKEDGLKSIWYLSNKTDPPGQIHFFNEQQNAVATYDLTNDTLTIRYNN